MKNLYPYPRWRKLRREGKITIVMNQLLTISYLNETSSFIIHHIDGRTSINDLVDKLLMEYDVKREVIEDDLCDVIRNMQWENIIGLAKSPHPIF